MKIPLFTKKNSFLSKKCCLNDADFLLKTYFYLKIDLFKYFIGLKGWKMVIFSHLMWKIALFSKKTDFYVKYCAQIIQFVIKTIFFFTTELMKCLIDSTSRKMTIFSHLKWKIAIFRKKNSFFSKMLCSNHTICYQNHIFVKLNFKVPHWFKRQKNVYF